MTNHGPDGSTFDRGRGHWQQRRKPMPRQRRYLPAVSTKTRAQRESRAEVREQLWKRDGGECILDDRRHAHLLTGQCFGGATPHHLLKAGQGGAYQLDNLLTACVGHNTWVEDHPDRARDLGLVVLRGRIDHTEAARRRAAHGLTR